MSWGSRRCPTVNRALGLLDGGRLVELDVAAGTVVRELATLATRVTPRRLGRCCDGPDASTVVVALQDERVMTWRGDDVGSGAPCGSGRRGPLPACGRVACPARVLGVRRRCARSDRRACRCGWRRWSGGRVRHDGRHGGRSAVGSGARRLVDSGRTASVLFGPDGTLYVGTIAGDLLLVDPVPVDGQLRTFGNIADAAGGPPTPVCASARMLMGAST